MKNLPDGTAAPGPWPVSTGSNPFGITIDSSGNIYTTNFTSNTVTKILPDGTIAPGPWPVKTGINPLGVVIDKSTSLYTTNLNSYTVTKIIIGPL